ncbi:MAG: hypothetical protein EOQ44_25515 [Mesorhizobium sp.]|uniref:hypothetical protein n=1 Tax=Mesorhizobium sp. TaxID=1871066 RepID=UPI000FE5F8C4|nr:hypothetical protein [Mesorhizobium sp.]RWB40499.1 MAG: hypothetical protein EOQ44_25515 [Mesorhizobium sp.]
MSPHERMKALDENGDSYVVTFNFLGHPPCYRADVLSHSEDWLEIRHRNQKDYPVPWHVNMKMVAKIEIEVL